MIVNFSRVDTHLTQAQNALSSSDMAEAMRQMSLAIRELKEQTENLKRYAERELDQKENR